MFIFNWFTCEPITLSHLFWKTEITIALTLWLCSIECHNGHHRSRVNSHTLRVKELHLFVCLFVCLVVFLTSSSTTRLYRVRVPRLTSVHFTCCHTRGRAVRPWLLSQPVTLYWHRPKELRSLGALAILYTSMSCAHSCLKNTGFQWRHVPFKYLGQSLWVDKQNQRRPYTSVLGFRIKERIRTTWF